MDNQFTFKENEIGSLNLNLSGIFAIIGGCLYMFIQWIHPEDTFASVGTSRWILVAFLTMIMSLSNLIGITGITFYQKDKFKILGFLGYTVFCIFWLISMIFSFIEAFVLPLLVSSAPEFVVGMTGLFNNGPSTVDLGIFPALTLTAGLLYVSGGLFLGAASIKAGIFSKTATILLTVSAFVTMLSGVIPHPYDRLLAFPMGIALILLGYESITKPKTQP